MQVSALWCNLSGWSCSRENSGNETHWMDEVAMETALFTKRSAKR
jgi:hypothetical protein